MFNWLVGGLVDWWVGGLVGWVGWLVEPNSIGYRQESATGQNDGGPKQKG